MTNGNRLTAPDQLSAAQPEISPAPDGGFTRLAVASPFPAFHRVYAEAIADRSSGNVQRPSKRRIWCCLDTLVARHRQLQTLDMRLELLDAPHSPDGWKLSHSYRQD